MLLNAIPFVYFAEKVVHQDRFRILEAKITLMNEVLRRPSIPRRKQLSCAYKMYFLRYVSHCGLPHHEGAWKDFID